ncbi:MAG: 50S ribosomal protein L22 [Chloroflexota bacterium]
MEAQYRAVLRHARISPQKVHVLVDAIKGKKVEQALNILRFMPQKGAKILQKIVNSAVANAENRDRIDVDRLLVYNVTADQGATLKRFSARARGRGTRILKRTAHITVTLAAKAS